jgi:cytosine/creatinine deaminase
MMDFRTLPDAPALRLENLTVPGCLAGEAGDLVRAAITLADGRIVEDAPGAVSVDMAGAMALPAFVDMHLHLDKGHIWPRAANPDGSFAGALETVAADRAAHWSA